MAYVTSKHCVGRGSSPGTRGPYGTRLNFTPGGHIIFGSISNPPIHLESCSCTVKPSMASLPDRRRVNGPTGGTSPPAFARAGTQTSPAISPRSRLPGEIRKICKFSIFAKVYSRSTDNCANTFTSSQDRFSDIRIRLSLPRNRAILSFIISRSPSSIRTKAHLHGARSSTSAPLRSIFSSVASLH